MSCPYCAQSNTHKDANGYCRVYRCYERLQEDRRSQEGHRFNQYPEVQKVKTVRTIETYNYGKLIKTETVYS